MLLRRVAARVGVTGFSGTGSWGVIQSAAADNAIFSTYVTTGVWARRTNQIFMDFFEDSGGTYLDIGGNIGLTTIPIAKNQKVFCHCFEPDPVNFANLRDNISRSVLSNNVILHRLALFDKMGFLTFGLAKDGNLGDHRVVKKSSDRETICVEAVALDELDLLIEGRLGVKIDTQGAEAAVIVGGKATLAKASLVILEFCPFMIDQLDGDPEIIMSYICQFDRIAIVVGEADEDDLAFIPASLACERLRNAFIQHRTTESVYFDVVAERSLT